MKVAILHQWFVPNYRVRFFELLNQRTDSAYVVFHGEPPSGLGHAAAEGPFSFPDVRVASHQMLLPTSRALIYQPALSRIARDRFDAVVLGTHLQFLSNHAVFGLRKLQKRPVLYWGHGDEKVLDNGGTRTADGGVMAGLLMRAASAGVKLKYRASRLADGYLVYSEGGASRLRANGVDPDRITVVGNTLDMQEQIELHEQVLPHDERSLRRELGLDPDAAIFVYIGRIYAAKRVEDLVDAALLLSRMKLRRPFQVVVIGDGPSAAAVRARAEGLRNIVFTGSVYDPAQVARYLRVAVATVIPDLVGLAAAHSLAHGLPLITQASNGHGPEIEYLTPGRDAVIARSFQEFVGTLAEIVNSPTRAQELRTYALRARNGLSLDTMVDAFHQGVERTVSRVRATS